METNLDSGWWNIQSSLIGGFLDPRLPCFTALLVDTIQYSLNNGKSEKIFHTTYFWSYHAANLPNLLNAIGIGIQKAQIGACFICLEKTIHGMRFLTSHACIYKEKIKDETRG